MWIGYQWEWRRTKLEKLKLWITVKYALRETEWKKLMGSGILCQLLSSSIDMELFHNRFNDPPICLLCQWKNKLHERGIHDLLINYFQMKSSFDYSIMELFEWWWSLENWQFWCWKFSRNNLIISYSISCKIRTDDREACAEMIMINVYQ